MDTAMAALVIAGAALLLNVGIHIYSGGWNLSAKLTTMEQSLRTSINEARNEIEDRQDQVMRQMGDSLLALRQKINDVELEAARTFMRREEMISVKTEMSVAVRDLGAEIKVRLERMEAKIDDRA